MTRPLNLYDSSFEHDACGLGFVAELNRKPSHAIVDMGLEVLRRLAHRGAAGADPASGDGAGILCQMPQRFFERVLARDEKDLPLQGDYAVAVCFLPRKRDTCAAGMRVLEDAVGHFGQKLIAWRDVPTDPTVLGPVARSSMPLVGQLFIGRMCPQEDFERVLFMIRNRAERNAGNTGLYIASLSSRSVVYKSLALPERLARFYPDLRETDFHTSLALVHSRFSTNTFPTWERAHPYRRIAHNGEINTLRGNVTAMRALEGLLASDAFGEYIQEFKPIIRPGGSDSQSLDNVVDFLVASGRPIAHVMMMLVPEAWETSKSMPDELRAFYEYHSHLSVPWDGPAALCFTDGSRVGTVLDRNGLRPAKYVRTDDGLVVLASETGVLNLEPARIVERGRVQPGQMLLVDTEAGRVVPDEEIKRTLADEHPYRAWLDTARVAVPSAGVTTVFRSPQEERARLQRLFGYTREDVRSVLAPMASAGEEPVGSMGVDAPLAVLDPAPQLLFRYFKQQFAQVTNPPIDPIREALVMSLSTRLGRSRNILEATPEHAAAVVLPHPVLTPEGLDGLRGLSTAAVQVVTVSTLFAVKEDGALRRALEACAEATVRAVEGGATIVVLSDKGATPALAPVPSLLALGFVHTTLVRAEKRALCSLVVECGDAKEVHDIALLVGFGASAVCPYLAIETVLQAAAEREIQEPPQASVVATPGSAPEGHAAVGRYVKAVQKGLLKVMSKMGISTLASYTGAQIFEAIGLSRDVMEACFAGAVSPLGGIGFDVLADEVRTRHGRAFRSGPIARVAFDRASPLPTLGDLEVGGTYAWRAGGPKHLWSPESIAQLQKAVRLGDGSAYELYASLINDQGDAPVTLRGLWDFRPHGARVPLAEVEPAARIVRRFATGAMSFGSISKEAHENLAIAMNRIGGRSNTGEGGEDESRYVPDANGDSRRSAIKQVASGRFGVTARYLVSADEIQIKVAQGAKPGEGGQLPGHKVDAVIARVRHSTPGVTLISPPPHHDIYSIEDLAQLIFDLKNVNPSARISVKLVSESGVGTVAAGVAKAHADCIIIAGHDGGTGASPLSSIHNAGTPWELGLAEAHQVLTHNGLRRRVHVQVDGQLKTGRDVAFAALLGAEEFGFATAPLVASGCVMMRKCHLNTCPVGIATQDPVLRARFRGEPEHVIRYFFYVAEELRRIMAMLGFRTVDEMVGRADAILVRPTPPHRKAAALDFSRVLSVEDAPEPVVPKEAQDHGIADVLDVHLMQRARASLERGEPTSIAVEVQNKDRAVGAMLSGAVAARFGATGLHEGTIVVDATGTAGQSFGAFLATGITLSLQGDANDYVGKGLSGGVLAIRPPPGAGFVAHENVIVGNTCLYGATSGKAFFAGQAGERFCVRNSGATAVVEGVGDHGCEYMTGGTVVVLGPVGRNFGAGMSGGVAYLHGDPKVLGSRMAAGLLLEPLDADDREVLRDLLVAHVERTESERGRALLDGSDGGIEAFSKLISAEYKAVLTQAAATAAPRRE